VIGYVDKALRSLLQITVRANSREKGTTVTVWVDTAFNGYLVFSRQLIAELALEKEAETEAILADGSVVMLDSYVAYVEWCGQIIRSQVIANDGRLPLLGTELLVGCLLVVDYRSMEVSVNP
jgi:clan AA aspartic protease